MIIHFVRIGAITLLAILCMLLPYFPGQYDGLAATLSVMAQLSGVIGLLLVPIGILWLIYELRQRSPERRKLPLTDRGKYFRGVSLLAASLVAIVVSLGAAASMGISLAIATIALWSYIALQLLRRLKHMKDAGTRRFNPAPLYLICIPAFVALCRFLFMVPVAETSRISAIEHSEALLNDIEKYHSTHGHYPQTLLAVNRDYKPSVIGVKEFEYELNGQTYNVSFEFPSYALGAREIVMYNKIDEHLAISHDSDILLWTSEELRSRMGYHSVYDGPKPHWKYFWFD